MTDAGSITLNHALYLATRFEKERDAAYDVIGIVNKLHQPVRYARDVPVFDEFDEPVQYGTRCKTCGGYSWPCTTRQVLDAQLPKLFNQPPTEGNANT